MTNETRKFSAEEIDSHVAALDISDSNFDDKSIIIIRQLQSQNAELMAERDSINSKVMDLKMSLSILRDKHTKYTSALKWYVDQFEYHPKTSKTGVDLSQWKAKKTLIEDCGNVALLALDGD